MKTWVLAAGTVFFTISNAFGAVWYVDQDVTGEGGSHVVGGRVYDHRRRPR